MKNNRSIYQPHFLTAENRWVVGLAGRQTLAEVKAIVTERNNAQEAINMLVGDLPSDTCQKCGKVMTDEEINRRVTFCNNCQ